MLQPKSDHQVSKRPFRDFRWIGPNAVEKVLQNKNYKVRILNTNPSQILHCIWLRKLTTDTPLEDIYTNEKIRPDKDFVFPQEYLNSFAWEAESNTSLLDDPKLYCDPVVI